MTATLTAPDFSAVRNARQAMWADGDFDAVAVSMVIVGELLCEVVDVHPRQRVLDVATGSGNTAIAAARRGAEVIGTDYVPELLERARERAAAERLPIMFERADADDQPFPEATFDVVLTTFGAMFAPDQHNAARELPRVRRNPVARSVWPPGHRLETSPRCSRPWRRMFLHRRISIHPCSGVVKTGCISCSAMESTIS